ncbi:glycosyltransferase family 2 protein [Nonomuraea roseoviolacea]|uniref:Cellulose synthase/poly-beta-1,6-N-acetylglucosamine synthase-like glycosyltransferase n=1 Tax=Nonomuraea roseoviolacea subsp. carminata TaxID=160689 RepID=A0ABT1JY39_9ACTN|nr:glycosyltransferase family 2 protein [Nonomuraea roseoviolacea]MCP2346661.1 cellulose synthase/poly-beta-1,6-N-acetylglucosamine synthase-like glycosyltransferase [Nonomuraea roseoviolacea subsp. carminata]
MINVLVLCSLSAVLLVFTYTLGMYLESAGTTERPDGDGDGFSVVFLVPCLNEERVIAGTLRALPRGLVVVVDDGSDDGTAEVVRRVGGPRVRLFRREPPNARQGKGRALNHALRRLAEELPHGDHDRVLVCLMDADGRLDPGGLDRALPHFADPRVGAVQMGVRIGNRARSLLARMQDMEFVVYTWMFQRTRTGIGSAGLGGNGQIMRLSALLDLGDDPWSPSLTEDLDLGVRMVLAGWRTVCVPDATVSQQGLVSTRALAKQRSRWYQGHLQALRLVPSVVRGASGRMAIDLLNVLLSPLLIFVGAFMTLSLVASLVGVAFSPLAREQLIQPVPIASWYALTFGAAYLFGPLYARITGDMGRLRGLCYGHLFIVYNLIWLVAAWRGLWRAARGRRVWLKTERLTEPSPEHV